MLPPRAQERYEDAMLELTAVLKMYCPAERCGSLIVLDGLSTDVTQMECPFCSAFICIRSA
jgi:hypothetical protein